MNLLTHTHFTKRETLSYACVKTCDPRPVSPHIELPYDLVVSYDVTTLFTNIHTEEAVTCCKETSISGPHTIQQDQSHHRTHTYPAKPLPKQHLLPTEGELLQAVAELRYYSRIVANLYMEKVESRALRSFRGTAPSRWFRYVDDSKVRIKMQEIELNTDSSLMKKLIHVNCKANTCKCYMLELDQKDT